MRNSTESASMSSTAKFKTVSNLGLYRKSMIAGSLTIAHRRRETTQASASHLAPGSFFIFGDVPKVLACNRNREKKQQGASPKTGAALIACYLRSKTNSIRIRGMVINPRLR
jgi:hypothetical protein